MLRGKDKPHRYTPSQSSDKCKICRYAIQTLEGLVKHLLPHQFSFTCCTDWFDGKDDISFTAQTDMYVWGSLVLTPHTRPAEPLPT